MKLKIPPSNRVFKKHHMPTKPPSLKSVVMGWLNTEVYEEIMNCEPKISTKASKVIGHVSVEVPFDGYSDNETDFIALTNAQLVPLGYHVEFTYDGTGRGRDVCLISWSHNI